MKLKWDITGKGDEAWGAGITQYEGEVPPRGSYVARVKRMTVGAIKSQGDNHGKPRISVLLEVVGGAGVDGVRDTEYEYYGAPIWDGLNIIKTQTPKVNAFLHALTDGSEEAKRAIETAFWPPNGPDAKKEARKDGTDDVHIKAIGKCPIGSPNGEYLVRIITKLEPDPKGQMRAAVNQYLPYKGPQEPKTNGQVVDDTIADSDIIDDSSGDGDIIDAVEVLSSTSTVDAVDLDATIEDSPF
jgi:hypothetical protein